MEARRTRGSAKRRSGRVGRPGCRRRLSGCRRHAFRLDVRNAIKVLRRGRIRGCTRSRRWRWRRRAVRPSRIGNRIGQRGFRLPLSGQGRGSPDVALGVGTVVTGFPTWLSHVVTVKYPPGTRRRGAPSASSARVGIGCQGDNKKEHQSKGNSHGSSSLKVWGIESSAVHAIDRPWSADAGILNCCRPVSEIA